MKSKDGRFTVSCNCHYATPQYQHRQKDLNPRLSVLETDALPTELYLRIDQWTLVDSNHILRILLSANRSTFSIIQTSLSSAFTQSDFSPAHTPCLPSVRCGSRKIRTFGVLIRLGPLAEGWFRPLTHTSFLYTMQSQKRGTQPICVPIQKKIFLINLLIGYLFSYRLYSMYISHYHFLK